MTRWILGLCAGRGGEGVEALLAEVAGRAAGSAALGTLRVHVADWLFEPFPPDLRELLVAVSNRAPIDIRRVAIAHRLVGEFLASVGRRLADRASVSWQRILCAGCSPYPIWHEGDPRFASNVTIGAAAILAERTGLTIVSDFASRDLAAGGQGEPLTPVMDAVLFSDMTERRLLIHLGAMAQVVWLPPRGAAGEAKRQLASTPVAWVVGPGTLMLDALVQQLTAGKEREDVGGKYAVQGKQIGQLLDRWTNHPFLRRPPPRSAHRYIFGDEFAQSTVAMARQHKWASYDLLCTANHFVAWAIADSIRRWHSKNVTRPAEDGRFIDRLLLSGPGVRNGLLWRLLQEQFPTVPIMRTDELGYPAEAKEALDAALLACLALDGMPATLPSVTGASGSRLVGCITPGSGSNWTRCLQWMSGQDDLLSDDED
jgi:anhydro-N-acetylmuramic acid kinase